MSGFGLPAQVSGMMALLEAARPARVVSSWSARAGIEALAKLIPALTVRER
jgi:hypothetical protein